MGLTIKQRYDADAGNRLVALTADDLIAVFDGDTGATKIARVDALDDYGTIVDIVASLADLQTQINAISTQSAIVDIRGRATETSNVGTVTGASLQDLWAAGTDTRNPADQWTYQHVERIRNEMPTGADKTSVVITSTSGSSTITATSGTFASTDDGKLITATGIPASTYISFVSSTSATLRTAGGGAVTPTTPGTGLTTVLHSPDMAVTYLLKVAGLNSFTYTFNLPATGPGLSYLVNFDVVFTQGSDGLNHGHEAHLKVFNASTTNSTSVPADGLLIPEKVWYSDATSTDMGTVRQSCELRITPFKSTQAFYLRGNSLVMSTRGT